MGGAVSDLSNRPKKIIMDDDNTTRRGGTGSREEMTHADPRTRNEEEARGISNVTDLVDEVTTKIQSVSLTGDLDNDDDSRAQDEEKHEKLQEIQTKLDGMADFDFSKLANQIQNISVTGELDMDISRSQEKHHDEKEILTNLGEKVNGGKSELDGEEKVPADESTRSGHEEESDSGAESDDGSDENDKQEFQAIVPLPPLVQEDEVALLTIVEYRAKLYRFDSTTSQWKERGVGSIRLLESTVEPNKYRVVMWRDSIGTLACNFSLFPEIVVKNFQNDPKVLCWQCFDCTDEPRWETLTCRFGNEEKCSDFKNKMLQYAKLQTVSVKDEENGREETNSDSEKEQEESNSNSEKEQEESNSNSEKEQEESNGNSEKEQEESNGNPCEGCRGCDTDAYEFPAVPTITHLDEPLIDCTLGGDSYSGSPCLLFSSMLTN